MVNHRHILWIIVHSFLQNGKTEMTILASIPIIALIAFMLSGRISAITAYAANIRYDINSMIKENNALAGEIENLQAQLYNSNNINYIENRAIGELGMVYPDAGKKVYISADDMPQEGFGEVLKEKAYE